MMTLFYVLGIVSEDEASKSRVPGLERTIAKAKGTEFFVLVHQLSVAFAKSPFNTSTREKLVKINATAKERFPKRGGRKADTAKTKGKVAAKKTRKAAVKSKTASTKSTKKASKKAASVPVKKTKAAKKTGKKATQKKSAKPAAKKKSPTNRLAKKKPR